MTPSGTTTTASPPFAGRCGASTSTAGSLREAAPDDLIIISFSGHGYTDRDGMFYVFPSGVRANAAGEFTHETLADAIDLRRGHFAP